MASRGNRVDDAVRLLRKSVDGSEGSTGHLRAALASVEPRMVAAAAELSHAADELLPHLIVAFERLEHGQQSADPRCHAKAAILMALKELGLDDPELFIRGTKLFQYDPTYGLPYPGEETAADVRSISALALVNTSLDLSDVLRALVPLLYDTAPIVRSSVARALGACVRWEADLLLEAKVAAGDDDAAVLGECFIELLNRDAHRYVDLVSPFLKHKDPEVRLQAICTLSECRDPRGLAALIGSFRVSEDTPDGEERFLAIGRSRHGESKAFLLHRFELGDDDERQLVLLAARRGVHADELSGPMREIVESAGSPAVQRAFKAFFG